MGAAERRGPSRGFRRAGPAWCRSICSTRAIVCKWPGQPLRRRPDSRGKWRMSSPPAPSSIYAQRRARLAAQLGQGGIAIIPTAPERPRNRDNDFAFRRDSYFYYLTGFTEPGAALVLAHDGQSTLFCQPKDPEREIWDGYRLGPAAAPAALGVDAAHPITELDARLPRLLENSRCVWYPFGTHSGLAARLEGWLAAVPDDAGRPVHAARRDAPVQGRARARPDAPCQPDQRAGPYPRHAALGAHVALGPGAARIPSGGRTTACAARRRRAVHGLHLYRRRRRQCLR